MRHIIRLHRPVLRFVYTTQARHLSATTKLSREDTSIVHKDIVYLHIKAGHGGNGIQKYNGVGGDGASIFVRPTQGTRFSQLCEQFKANRLLKGKPGDDSKQVKLAGQSANPVIIPVPLGVECVDANTRMLLLRCTNPKLNYLIARGGAGGSQFNQYKGQKGASLRLAIHFKLTTNVGFVGLPNAGKSTLLKAMAPERKVKIADYPFTTLKPQVFDIEFDERTPDEKKFVDPDEIFSLSVADLPGVIEGASRNRGQGYAFLKHLEYSEIIIMVVDVHGFKLSSNYEEPFRNALESIAVLNKEMETYDKVLINKPVILVINKMDLNDGKEKANALAEQLAKAAIKWPKLLPAQLRPQIPIKFRAILTMSAKNGDIEDLKSALRRIYNELHPLEPLDNIDEELGEKSGQYIV